MRTKTYTVVFFERAQSSANRKNKMKVLSVGVLTYMEIHILRKPIKQIQKIISLHGTQQKYAKAGKAQ